MKLFEISCKTALTVSRLAGLRYALNPYKGCAHGCKYCYAPNVLHIPRKEWGEWVGAKINIPNLLSRELKEKERGVIGIGTVTDPYQPAERDCKLTRYSLEQIQKADWPVSLQSKSDLVLRDLDLLKLFSRVEVGITITTLNDEHRKLLEPNAPSINKRLFTLRKLAEEEIRTYIFFGPAYPTLDLEELPSLVDTFIETGAKELMVDRLNLKQGIWEDIEFALRNNLGLLNQFKKNNNSSYYNQLFSVIQNRCKGKIKFTNCIKGKYHE
jgi:DNA repair photolyase